MTALESQRVRLHNLQGSVNLVGVPTDVRGALQRTMEVESLIGLHDINPNFTAAARLVRVVSTPLAAEAVTAAVAAVSGAPLGAARATGLGAQHEGPRTKP